MSKKVQSKKRSNKVTISNFDKQVFSDKEDKDKSIFINSHPPTITRITKKVEVKSQINKNTFAYNNQDRILESDVKNTTI